MFIPSSAPRVFAMPPGCEFAAEFVSGLKRRLEGQPPDAIARVEIYLNTRRTQRRIVDEFVNRGPGLLPDLRLVTDLAHDPRYALIPSAVSPLRRRLELAQLIKKLLEGDQRFSARATVFELAHSLADLMDEMRGEGVDPDDLRSLDLTHHSAHWEQSLRFIEIIERHWGKNAVPDTEARRRMVTERLISDWSSNPPDHPVIVAGSTGSRGTTQLLMRAVAQLPQGCLVLPCFDFDMPPEIWSELDDAMVAEDHPQFRFKSLANALKMQPGDVVPWNAEFQVNAARNRLVSLALRPAPVTDQWMTAGPKLRNVEAATEHLSLVEAPNSRIESVAIALLLRESAEKGESAALVTPDKTLARQVTAALLRWEIRPFDSTGDRLSQTSLGRFLRQIAEILGTASTAESLISLLKHPFAHSGDGRAHHSDLTSDLESELRRAAPVRDVADHIWDWSDRQNLSEFDSQWADWLCSCLEMIRDVGEDRLDILIDRHIEIAEAIAAGSDSSGPGALWDGNTGAAVQKAMTALRADAEAGGTYNPADYVALLSRFLSWQSVYHSHEAYPGIMIWGTIDCRMQRPDVVIAAGLNEAIWPALSPQDPWLNREMRKQIGLLLPERRTGLAAHDFQQAIAAPRVFLTRSVSDADAPTRPSRWIARLISLLAGIGERGEQALASMRNRGQQYVDFAERLDAADSLPSPATRPSPAPPGETRPKKLSVTEIRTLVTDPYAIYAKHVLKLRRLKPLHYTPEPMLRGTLIHSIFKSFIEEAMGSPESISSENLLEIAELALADAAIPRNASRMWLASIRRIADQFVENEILRQTDCRPCKFEHMGEIDFPELDFQLVAKADRIDSGDQSERAIYDYKTGKLPSKTLIKYVDKQIPLQTMMLELGGFGEDVCGDVHRAGYIRVCNETEESNVQRWEETSAGPKDLFHEAWVEFQMLIQHYRNCRHGYTSRNLPQRLTWGGDYDHLARFGEWDDSAEPVLERLE